MKNRYCILQKKEGSLVKDYSTSVVVVYLYYLDKIEFCLKYLKNIMSYILQKREQIV